MLIALVFATTTIQAQSARRSATKDNKEQVTASHQAKSSQPVKREQTQQVRNQQARTTQPAQAKQTQQVRNQQARTTQPAQTKQTQQVRNQQVRTTQPAQNRQTQQVRKPVSMSTSNNPRSTYREPNNRITAEPRYSAPVKSNKYTQMRYYGGNHYHYAYPTHKVNLHYHYDTYVNHYNVLYYPSYGNIYWTRNMYRNYSNWYPGFHWSYNYGYRIETISIFDAKYNLGEVVMVYGRVYSTWYNEETDDYLLFFGGDFPYQQFTAVIPGHVARKFSWRPENYFLGEHITITGLITTFDGSPEIVVKNKQQLSLY
jgi:hypothetical protein